MLPQLIDRENIHEFLKEFDTILTDCDGVLWCGDNVVPGANTSLNKLRILDKRVFFVTNNCSMSRATLLAKAINLGFEAHMEETLSASYAFAEHLKQIDFKGKVYVMGTDGIGSELKLAGIPHVGIGAIDVPNNVFDLIESLKLDPDVKAVVIGADPYFNITKLITAASYIGNPACLFFGTTKEIRFPPSSSNIVLPGTGAIVTCVEAATGRVAEIIGKPEHRMFTLLANKHNLNPERTLMIGDNSETDILLGKNCGLKTLSVLTGVTSLEDITKWNLSAEAKDKRKLADYYMYSIGGFNDLLD